MPKFLREISLWILAISLAVPIIYYGPGSVGITPFFQKTFAAFPAVQTTNESNETTATNSHQVSLPANIASGDLLVIIFGHSNAVTVNALTGWSELVDDGLANSAAVLVRTADGAEGASVTVGTSGNAKSAHISYRISGAANVTNQLPTISTVATGTSNAPNPTSSSPGTARDYLWLTFFVQAGEEADDDTWTNNAATNYSGLLQKTTGTGGTAATNHSIAVSQRTNNATSEDAAWPTGSTDQSLGWRAWTIGVHPNPLFSQAAFRFYEDGTESGSSPIADQDLDINRGVESNSNLHLRFRIDETNTGLGATTDDWQLQYSKNAGGYTDVTGASSNVIGFSSTNLTDGGATTDRATNGISNPGSGSFVAGKISEDGLLDDHQLTSSNFTEHLYSITLIAADLANNDTLDFRILYNGAATDMTYSQTPTITVKKALFSQAAFRFYEDGTESGSSPIDAQDADISRATDSNSNLHLRFRVDETNAVSGLSTDDWQLQYSKNAGVYTDVTGASSNVIGFNSGSLTDGGATTNRATNGITDGSGSFVAGLISEDGLLDNHQLTASNFTEHLYSLTLIAADLANNDTLDFRVLRNGVITGITYTVTPTITVSKTPTGPTTDQVMRHGNWFNGGVEQSFFWAN